MTTRTVDIVGAGPSGLSAALAAHEQGAEVTVYEKRLDVGARFHGDFQGLENWTSDTDVLAELAGLGIQANFAHTPVYEIVCLNADGSTHTVNAKEPIFYLVRRGRDAGTLDHALKAQALEAGVNLRFGERLRHIPSGGVIAEGPHRADVIAVGYVFDTDMTNGCYVTVGDQFAPAGYSYLLIDQGRGTVATCLFDRFHDERQYLDATVAFFEREVGLRWHTAKRFGGSGNYRRVEHTVMGNRCYVGEAAGFQDALFGFGLRYALISGSLAGRGGGLTSEYEQAWKKFLGGLNAASVFNRWFYTRIGDRGRRMVLKRAVAGRDPRVLLKRIYAPRPWKVTLSRHVAQPSTLTTAHSREDCDCTWCRCRRDAQPNADRAPA